MHVVLMCGVYELLTWMEANLVYMLIQEFKMYDDIYEFMQLTRCITSFMK